MSVNIRRKIERLDAVRRRKIEARATELMAEEMSLRDLRRARKLTQVRVAEALGVTQDSVSRLEKRSDFLLSTLRKTVNAMGGEICIYCTFPDRAPVVLSQLSEVSGEAEPPRARTAAPHRSARLRASRYEARARSKKV